MWDWNLRPSDFRSDPLLTELASLTQGRLIYDQFGAIREPDFRRVVCKIYIFISKRLLYHTKIQNKTKKISKTALILLL